MFKAAQNCSLIDKLTQCGVIDPFAIPSRTLVSLTGEEQALVKAGSHVVKVVCEEPGSWSIVLCSREGQRRILTPSFGHPSEDAAQRVLDVNADLFAQAIH